MFLTNVRYFQVLEGKVGRKTEMHVSVWLGVPAARFPDCLPACVCAAHFYQYRQTTSYSRCSACRQKQTANTDKQTQAVFLFFQPAVPQLVSRIVPIIPVLRTHAPVIPRVNYTVAMETPPLYTVGTKTIFTNSDPKHCPQQQKKHSLGVH